jgi:prolipoprotein diacylglyceryltransferase
MSRFAVVSAAVLGVLFPLLETLRRGLGAWLTTPVTLLEDYVAGALLLWAAAFLAQRRPSGWVVMLAAAAYATGMMSSSFWKQLEAQLTGETWEANQGVVIAFKLFLWGLPLILTILSARALLRERNGR